MTTRLGYVIGLAVCVALLAFALYLQHFENQEPCPLCILQRVAFIVMMGVFAAAAIHNPRRKGALAYSGAIVLIATVGGAIAGRQVWLQHLPPNKVPACGPGLQYMFERFPLMQALKKVLAGSGECAEVTWKFLGLTIAGWSLVWFVILGIFAIMVAVNAPGARATATPAR